VEAIRSEKGQTPHRPLLAYMDEAAIKKHVQPWQQILAFIARTQAPHNWTSPKYGMTARQRQKWRQLWQLASQAPGQPSPNHQGSQAALLGDPEDLEAWAMTTIEKACLEFCIELLNQRHRSHEYESILVCAMAVLGQGETGWRDPESYPPILSRVIKVAHSRSFRPGCGRTRAPNGYWPARMINWGRSMRDMAVMTPHPPQRPHHRPHHPSIVMTHCPRSTFGRAAGHSRSR
jgi:hypothetical protein